MNTEKKDSDLKRVLQCVFFSCSCLRGTAARLAWVKRVVYNGMQMDLRSAIDYERFIVSSIYQTADRKEGIGAFLEKRDAKFKGE